MGEAKRKRDARNRLSIGGVTFTQISTGIAQADFSHPDRITLAGITLGLPNIGTIVRRMLEDEHARVLAQYGPAAFECPRHAAAIHEAGHVVLYAIQGVVVDHTRIERTPSGWIGFTSAPDCAFRIEHGVGESLELYLNRARQLAAGVIAEELFDRDFRRGSSLDEVVMSQVLAVKASLLAGAADEGRYWQQEVWRATGIVLQRHRQAVMEIAHDLHDCERLSGAALARWTGPISSRS